MKKMTFAELQATVAPIDCLNKVTMQATKGGVSLTTEQIIQILWANGGGTWTNDGSDNGVFSLPAPPQSTLSESTEDEIWNYIGGGTPGNPGDGYWFTDPSDGQRHWMKIEPEVVITSSKNPVVLESYYGNGFSYQVLKMGNGDAYNFAGDLSDIHGYISYGMGLLSAGGGTWGTIVGGVLGTVGQLQSGQLSDIQSAIHFGGGGPVIVTIEHTYNGYGGSSTRYVFEDGAGNQYGTFQSHY